MAKALTLNVNGALIANQLRNSILERKTKSF